MRILNLSIKRKFFDAILSGEKKTEAREIRPTNSQKYGYYENCGIKYDKFSEMPENLINDDLRFNAKKYDALKLFTGAYSEKRPYLVVEILAEKINLFKDDNDCYVKYEYDGSEYYMTQIVYDLGRIIEIELYK